MSGATWLVTLVALAVRLSLWFLRPGLTYDGTYYLRQAERLIHLDYELIGFPPGYPLVVALVRFVTGDFELAGRYVSLLSGTATVALFHVWARRKLPAPLALAGAFFLALHPEVARTSVEVLSEPLYILIVVSAVVAFEARRDLLAGCLCGYAYLVRPEAVAVTVACIVVRTWEATRRRQGADAGRFPLPLLLGSLLPVVVFSALWTAAVGHWVLTPKQGQLDLDASIATRLWKMLTSMHAVFPVFLAPPALYQAWRSRSILVAGLLYVGTLPFFALHIQPRLLQPALPFLLLLALAWLAALRLVWRRALLVAAAGFAVWGAVPTARALFRDGIVTPFDRSLGAALRPKLDFDDRVASRFPIVPYYAGAGFVRIPVSSYIATMDSLTQAGATHLLLLEHEALGMVPQLRPLFDDAGFATAEARLELVQTVTPGDGPRAILYRFVPPALAAAATTRVDSTATSAAWVGDTLVFTTADGALRRAGPPLGPEVEVSLERVRGARDVQAGANAIVFRMGTAAGAEVATLDLESGGLQALASTAADAPVSPCFVGGAILYVRGAGSGGLRALSPESQRVRPVYFSGLDPAEATPLFVTARGSDVAITYVRSRRERDDQRVLATAAWPAAAAATDTAIVLHGRWASQLALADHAIAWVPGADRLLACVAIRELDAEGRDAGGFSSLAVVAAGGHMRVLAFDLTAPRRPAPAPQKLAFIVERSQLCTAPLRAEALRVPELRVFDAPRSSLLPPGR